jgi:hypothetical protein
MTLQVSTWTKAGTMPVRVGVAIGVALVSALALASPVASAADAARPSAFIAPRDAPGAPTGLQHSPWQRQGQTYRTNVSWAAPENLGGYEAVTYAAEIERDGDVILELEFDNPVIVLRRLIKGQTYTVRVYAVNDDGRGPPADIVLRVPGRIPADGGGSDPGELAGPRPLITGVSPKVGGVGSFVRITGQNLDNLRYVRFGTRLAGFFVDSTGALVATAPGGSGTVDIEVATTGGVATARKAFTYAARSTGSSMEYGRR